MVGALLAGGATTGTTRASWTDAAVLPPTAVDSGRMGFAVAPPTAVPSLAPDGSPGTTTLTVTDTSAGKNLTQRITATVTGRPPGVTATIGTSCGAATQPSASVDRGPGGMATLCLKVVASGTAASGDVTVDLSGAQLPSGWSSPPRTVTVPITVEQPATTPTIRCGTEVSGVGHSFEWDAVPGVTSYSIYQATSANGPFGAPLAVGSGLSHTAVLPTKNDTLYFRITAVVGGVESTPSNVLRVRRNGNSVNFGCGAP